MEAAVQLWAQVLDRIAGDKKLTPAVDEVIQAAHDLCREPVVRRVYRYADVGRHRTELVDMAFGLGPETQETFALAMSDMGTSRLVADEIPLLAAAFRLSGDPVIEERLFEQLTEMAAWSPMQRPGWTLFNPDTRLPPDGKDGNWLATGPGVRAIADALDIVPAESMPDPLRKRLYLLLEKEVEDIAENWRVKRTWFAKYRVLNNQWVVPTEGLVRACLVVGREKCADEYELGVSNLLASLDAHGADGEFEEGLTYAVVTVASLIHAARAMAVEGDMRALDHPYLQRFPTWAAHHFQPGEMMVNAFNSGWAVRGGAWRTRPLISALTACTGSRTGLWTLATLVGGPSSDPAGLATRALPPATDADAPPLFAAYERATLVTWRNSWDSDADGVWVRGGHELDA
ncbi:MAG: heparinase, partial [Lentisphaerae bacterium]|nr:heparinase [Lentisphaerota bacterium]